MNRVIKFRAWNFRKKEFVKDEYLLTDSVNGLMKIAGVTYKRDPNDMDDEVGITQFTGLHDKNNKEIYEGDLVKCLSGTLNAEVVWFNGAWCLDTHNESTKNNPLEMYYFSECEVIGNIYENPELI